MARGWESKSVESQIDAADDRRVAAERARISDEAIRVKAERAGLELSIERISRELAATNHERRREQLAGALAHLHEQLAKVK